MITVTDPCGNCQRGAAIRKDGKVIGYQSVCTGKCFTAPDIMHNPEIPSATTFINKALTKHRQKK